MIISGIYCAVKIFPVETGILRSVAIFSFAYTIGEWIIFTALRRRRILVHMAEQYEDQELEHHIDVETGAFDTFILPIGVTHQNSLYAPNPPTTSSNSYSTYQEPVPSPNQHASRQPDPTSLNALGSTYQGDNANPSETSPQPPVLAQQNSSSQPGRRMAPGARRHVSTQNSRIGHVGGSTGPQHALPTNTTLFSPFRSE
eukprot:UN04603